MEAQKNLWKLFKVNNNTSEQRQWRRSGVFISNFEQILHIVPMFASMTLNK